jgi:hypothetical protein
VVLPAEGRPLAGLEDVENVVTTWSGEAEPLP